MRTSCFGLLCSCLVQIQCRILKSLSFSYTHSTFHRFLSIDVDTVNAVTLEDAKNAVMSQLMPKDIEISVSGDFVVNDVLDMILRNLWM